VVVREVKSDQLPTGGKVWTDEDYRKRDEALAKLGIKIGRKK